MATSPLFGWQEPDDTSLVKDGAAAIRTLGNAIDTSMGDLLGGTTGQVLAKASNTNMDFTWVAQDDSNAIQNAIVNAKGDIIGASANDTPAITSVGANNTVLVADSTTATGLKYTSSLTGLTTVTTSADSTINGVRAGRGNSGGATNTAFGSGALNVNTTGDFATAIGNGALFDQTTGAQNTAVGSEALANTTTGSYNVAMGVLASGLATTANENTAVGAYALYSNVTGAANAGFGQGALGNSTGNGNSALGMSAGSNVTTGGNNTLIGYFAAASSATASNAITLGNSSVSTLRCQVTSITSLSDERDKKDIAPLEHGLDFVKQLKPVSFEWNARPTKHTDHEGNEIELQGKVGIPDIGFIAQDIVALEDSLGAANFLQLSYRDNPEKLEVTQGRLIPILVKAIQDLTAKVEALEAAQA